MASEGKEDFKAETDADLSFDASRLDEMNIVLGGIEASFDPDPADTFCNPAAFVCRKWK